MDSVVQGDREEGREEGGKQFLKSRRDLVLKLKLLRAGARMPDAILAILIFLFHVIKHRFLRRPFGWR